MPNKTPTTTVRLTKEERRQLVELADRAGVSLSDALRNGARIYLEALLLPRSKRGVKLGA